MTKIIADCCANHMGYRLIIERMIESLASIRVDIAKFQSWQADKLRKDWPNYEQEYAYYKQHELSDDDHLFIIDKCKQYGIEPLFTVFDIERVDFLCSIGMKKVKIASPDANSWALIDKCLEKFDEVIISTGMHTWEEIKLLWDYILKNRAVGKTTLLKCVSKYPVDLTEVSLLPVKYYCGMELMGYSDHTLGTDAAKLAIALGAKYVEKHFTLNRNLPGKDQFFSGTLDEFRDLVEWRDKVKIMMSPIEGMPDREARRAIGKWGNNA